MYEAMQKEDVRTLNCTLLCISCSCISSINVGDM